MKLNLPNSTDISDLPEFKTWFGMIRRCYIDSVSNTNYKYYRGRNIKVCNRWLVSFENFYSDMGKRPKGDYSIDRINPNGNYEPSNCRWATRSQQQSNRRTYGKSGHKNIFYKHGKYEVSFNRNGLFSYHGRYLDIKDAIKTRDKNAV